MTVEQERWTEALAVEQQHGIDGNMFIVNKVSALLAAGDEAGVERWMAIASRYDQLHNGWRLRPHA